VWRMVSSSALFGVELLLISSVSAFLSHTGEIRLILSVLD
jgi:hypothetical protein